MRFLKFCLYLVKDYTDLLEKLLCTIVIASLAAPFIALCFGFMAMVYTTAIVLSIYGIFFLALIIVKMGDGVCTEYSIYETDDERIMSRLKGFYRKR